MKIAVVILNWNGQKLLEQFIPSIVSHSADAEIIVIDNDSSDASVLWLKENHPDIKIISNEKNIGYAGGYNEGLKHVSADILALVNSDIEVSENWLIPIRKAFAEHEKMAVLQPKILDYKNKTKFEYAGASGGFIDKLGYPYCRGRLFTEIEVDKKQYDKFSEIFWASGACFFIRKNIFDEVGGFDEDYFAHMEEVDLCWRIHNYGHKVMYEPNSVVYHVGGATLKNSNPQKTYLNFRNSLFTIVKNTPLKKMFFIIKYRLILDGVAGVKFILDGDWAHTVAIIKAHFSFYKHFMKMYKKRNKKNISSNKYFIHKSIVFQFFILNRKKFTDLK